MLLQTVLGLIGVGGVVYWQRAVLEALYLNPQTLVYGFWISVGLGALIVLALLRALYLLGFYVRENRLIDEFVELLDFTLTEAGLSKIRRSLIVRRYRAMQQTQSVVSLPTLQRVLREEEWARASLVRMIRRSLIAAGVLGAIFSLWVSAVSTSEAMSILTQRGGGWGNFWQELMWALIQSSDAMTKGGTAALTAISTALVGYIILLLVETRVSASRQFVCHRVEFLSLRQLAPMLDG